MASISVCQYIILCCVPSSYHMGGQVVGEYLLGSASTSHLGLAGSLVEIVVIMYPTSLPPHYPPHSHLTPTSPHSHLTPTSLPPHSHLTPTSLPPHSHLTPTSLPTSLPPHSHLNPTSLPPHSHLNPTSLPPHSHLTTHLTPTSIPPHSHLTPTSLPPHYVFTQNKPICTFHNISNALP